MELSIQILFATLVALTYATPLSVVIPLTPSAKFDSEVQNSIKLLIWEKRRENWSQPPQQDQPKNDCVRFTFDKHHYHEDTLYLANQKVLKAFALKDKSGRETREFITAEMQQYMKSLENRICEEQIQRAVQGYSSSSSSSSRAVESKRSGRYFAPAPTR